MKPKNPTNPTNPDQPMNLEDPRISAWLMPDAAAMSAEDRAAVEAALAADPQLAAAVEQLRALTAQLETHYQSAAYVDDADLLLDQGRRAAILAEDPADADAAAGAAADGVTPSRAPRRAARPAVTTLSNLSRWDRQPWFVRLGAIAATFWLLGLPMLRWGGAQLLYRTGLGTVITGMAGRCAIECRARKRGEVLLLTKGRSISMARTAPPACWTTSCAETMARRRAWWRCDRDPAVMPTAGSDAAGSVDPGPLLMGIRWRQRIG